MAPEIDQPFGIRVLMWLSLVTGVWAILGLVVFFTHPLFLSKYAVPETGVQRAMSIAVGLLYMPLFWGIRRRSVIAWKFGWFLLVLSFSGSLAYALESIRKQPGSGGWAALAVVTVGFSSVAIYWGCWWYRQKKNFS